MDCQTTKSKPFKHYWLWKFCSLLCKLHHSTNHFSSCCPLLHFHLAAFFIFCTIGLSLFFSSSWHRACFHSSRMSLLLTPFLNLHYIHYHSFLGSWHKRATAELDLSRWLQKCCFVIINTYCIYVKMQTYPERSYRLIFHGSLTLLTCYKLLLFFNQL